MLSRSAKAIEQVCLRRDGEQIGEAENALFELQRLS
jgi:hypothetical protein